MPHDVHKYIHTHYTDCVNLAVIVTVRAVATECIVFVGVFSLLAAR